MAKIFLRIFIIKTLMLLKWYWCKIEIENIFCEFADQISSTLAEKDNHQHVPLFIILGFTTYKSFQAKKHFLAKQSRIGQFICLLIFFILFFQELTGSLSCFPSKFLVSLKEIWTDVCWLLPEIIASRRFASGSDGTVKSFLF